MDLTEEKVLLERSTLVKREWGKGRCLFIDIGAESRNRTGTLSPARDFESRASTYSAISATEDRHYR